MIHSDNSRRAGSALEEAYQFVLWRVPTVEKCPRSQRFLLGDRLQQTAVDKLEFAQLGPSFLRSLDGIGEAVVQVALGPTGYPRTASCCPLDYV